MTNFFKINNRVFETKCAFPPIDEEKIQNAIMIAPYNGEMYVYIWNCWSYTDNENDCAWGWEPAFPLNSGDGKDLISLIYEIRTRLGI